MGLKRVLGAGDAAWLVAGSMIGAGIFYTPGLVAARLPGAAWPVGAWLIGGALALSGAAVYAELGSRLPRAGGDYQYLTHAFGPVWGFLTGWAAFTMTFSAAVSAMCLVVVDYLALAAWGTAPPPGVRLAAAPALVLLLTVANASGARTAGRATAWLTAVPVLGVVVLFVWGLVARPDQVVLPPLWAAPEGAWPAALGTALVPIYFTYTGWNSAAYLAGEIRDPERNLARALLLGTAGVTILYVAFNVAVLASVPAAELDGSTVAGAQAVRRLLGPGAERALSLVIALAVTGTANVTLMAGSRVYYAMAVDGSAPRFLGRVNAAGVPASALWLSGLWTAALATIGRVEVLVNWATLAILLLSSLTVVSLFVLRRREPTADAYRCPGYPLVPATYLVACLAVALASAWNEPRQAVFGIGVVVLGVPLYFLLRRPPTGGS